MPSEDETVSKLTKRWSDVVPLPVASQQAYWELRQAVIRNLSAGLAPEEVCRFLAIGNDRLKRIIS
jgi:hypothetical protein